MDEEPLLDSRVLIQRLVANDQQYYSDRDLRTLQQRLHGYRLQLIELEMAETGEAQAR